MTTIRDPGLLGTILDLMYEEGSEGYLEFRGCILQVGVSSVLITRPGWTTNDVAYLYDYLERNCVRSYAGVNPMTYKFAGVTWGSPYLKVDRILQGKAEEVQAFARLLGNYLKS